MDLEETEIRNDCADEGQEQFNRPTENPAVATLDLGTISAFAWRERKTKKT
jgi:hypothetical protein